MKLSYEEIYIVHNHMMAKTHKELIALGRSDLAKRLQDMAQEPDGAFILHSLIAVVMGMCELDAATEPQKDA